MTTTEWLIGAAGLLAGWLLAFPAGWYAARCLFALAVRDSMRIGFDSGVRHARIDLVSALRTPRPAAPRNRGSWIDDLTGPDVAPRPANPHYHCSTASHQPCPTGEHTNPAPRVAPAAAAIRRGYPESA
jgi:hypothetical protein